MAPSESDVPTLELTMQQDVPRPSRIAQHMIRVCEKLMNGGDTALRVAKEDQSPLRARRYDRHDRGGPDSSADDPGYNDQTGAAACARVGRKGTLYDTYVSALRHLDTGLVSVESAYEKIMGKAKRHEAERRARAPGAGRCVACNDWMPGTREHRIKDGFCSSRHYPGWHRAKRRGETRSDYIARVRRNGGVDSQYDTEA